MSTTTRPTSTWCRPTNHIGGLAAVRQSAAAGTMRSATRPSQLGMSRNVVASTTISSACRRVDTAGHQGPRTARHTSRSARMVQKPKAPAAPQAIACASIRRSAPGTLTRSCATTALACSTLDGPLSAMQDGAGERAHRSQLGAHDRGARNRQRAEDRLVARVEGQAVPGDHRDERQQDHRHADEQERVVDGADRVQGRHRERRQDEPRPAQHRHEGADREQRRQAQGGAAVRVRFRRQQVVVEEPRDEVPRQQPPGCRRRPGRRRVSHAPPRRRSIAPCARDPRGGPARRRRPRATCAIAAPAARSPSRRRRPCRGGAR